MYSGNSNSIENPSPLITATLMIETISSNTNCVSNETLLSFMKEAQQSAYFADLQARFSWLGSQTIPRYVYLDGTHSKCPPDQTCTYDWNLGDGNTASGETIFYTFPAQGYYDVILTVTDEHYYSDQETRTVYANDLLPPPPPSAEAVFNPDTGYVDLTVTGGENKLKSFYVSWGDGSSTEYYGAYNLESKTVSHPYIPGTYTIGVYIFDMTNKSFLIWLDPITVN